MPAISRDHTVWFEAANGRRCSVRSYALGQERRVVAADDEAGCFVTNWFLVGHIVTDPEGPASSVGHLVFDYGNGREVRAGPVTLSILEADFEAASIRYAFSSPVSSIVEISLAKTRPAEQEEELTPNTLRALLGSPGDGASEARFDGEGGIRP